MKKQTLLFVPGWGIPDSGYEELCGEFRKHFHVIRVNWRGLQNAAEIPDRIQDVLQNQDSPVFAAGHSMGALALIDAAMKNFAMIGKMVLISGTSCFIKKPGVYSSGWDKRVLERMRSRIQQNPVPVLGDFHQALFTREEIQEGFAKSFLGSISGDLKTLDGEGLVQGLSYLIESDFRRKLKEISVPVLLVHGGRDPICPASASEYIYENLTCRKEYFAADGAGHMPFMTRNKDVICNILKYLRK